MIEERPIVPVLLCGGVGLRLWPLSRSGRPKQLLPLVSKQTMLQATALRLPSGDAFSPPLVVTGSDFAAEVCEQLAQVGVTARLIVEPCARNTAPAIALAALSCHADDLVLVMPCDHVIGDAAAFRRAVDAAIGLARNGWLVTFGVPPERPETGYGYIKRGSELGSGLFEVERFIEKPDLATTNAFLRDGGYDWNAGIFLFRVRAYLAALERFEPRIVAAASAGLAAGSIEGDRIMPDGTAFGPSPSISIDNAVMERATQIAVVPVEMGWSDIGSWEALYMVSPKDEQGNVRSADVLAIESRGCLLRTTGPRVVAIGVENLVVVATGDSVLIVPREQSQRVKDVVERLAEPNSNP